jgi:diphthamide biosynthesis protein 7
MPTHTAFTVSPPSCLSFSLLDPTLLVVGTYTLDEAATTLETKKTGTLELYRVSSGGLSHLQSLPTSMGAVLDLKFSPREQDLVAVAESRGAVSLYRIDAAVGRIAHERTLALFPPEVLVLSLTFSPTGANVLAVTLSDGGVAVLDLAKGETSYAYVPHSLEAWTCEFSRDGKRLFSGGDDSIMIVQDLEAQVEVGRTRRGAHEAGVTAILAQEDGGVWSGSYDETLRVWDLRGRIKAVEEKSLGGGVWRLLEMGGDKVLASCMHAGGRVVRKQDLEVVATWEENESMNYGGHVHPNAPEVIASCSFYDKRLCIWSI